MKRLDFSLNFSRGIDGARRGVGRVRRRSRGDAYAGGTWLAHFERMDRPKVRLAEMLGVPVDLIEEPSPSPRIQKAIEQDRVRAF